jgi:urease accessory protein
MTELAEPLVATGEVEHEAGRGTVELRRIEDRTVVTRARANSPLKLLNPRADGSGAWIFSSTFGGGLVAGDEIALDLHMGDGCSCLLGTQSATKVYRSTKGLSARQTLNVTVGRDATCVIAPHPVTCFARARFVQRQRIDMKPGASLVLIDWFTSGRHAAGERWAFENYDSRTDIFVEGRHVFRDALKLCREGGPIDSAHRTGGFNCFAYAVVLGRAFAEPVKECVRQIERQPIDADPHSPLIFAAGPLGGAGAVFRAAGAGSEVVRDWLIEQLAFVGGALGSDRWSRLLG